MIYFEIRKDNRPEATVSIRKMNLVQRGPARYAYEVFGEKRRHRGTVEHDGPEDFALVAAVLNDYVSYHGG